MKNTKYLTYSSLIVLILYASWITGIQLLDHDVFEYLSYYKIMFVEGWNPYDYWVQAHSWINVRTGFLLHIRALESVFGLQWAFFIGYAMTFVFAILAMIRIAKQIGKSLKIDYLHYWTIAFLVTAPWTKYFVDMVGGNDFIYDHLKSSFAATTVVLWAIAFWLEKRNQIAFFLAGYAVFIHVQLGGLVVLLLFFITAYENKLDFKKTLFQVYPAFFWSPLPLWLAFELFINTPSLDSQFLFDAILWRMPHHISPSYFGSVRWERLVGRVIFVLILIALLKRQKECCLDRNRISALVIASIITIAVVSILIEWGQVLLAVQTQAFRLDMIFVLFGTIGFVCVLLLLSKRFFRYSWVMPAILLVFAAFFDSYGKKRNLRPMTERFRNLELPGQSSRDVDTFFNKAKEQIQANAVVLAVGADVQGRVILLWNTPLFWGYKNPPQNRSIWKEYYERGKLQQQFEKQSSLAIIEKMNTYQKIRYVAADQQILQWKPLLKYGVYHLYDLTQVQ